LNNLPRILKNLWCINNNLISINNIPNTLKTLWYYDNNLIFIYLPVNLHTLNCDKNVILYGNMNMNINKIYN